MSLLKTWERRRFEERIEKARNGFMFSLEILEKDYDLKSPEGKTGFLNEAARRLGRFEEEIERNNYIEAVAEKYHTGYEELRRLVGKMAVREGLAKPVQRPKTAGAKEKGRRDQEVAEDSSDLAGIGRKDFWTDQGLYFTGGFF